MLCVGRKGVRGSGNGSTAAGRDEGRLVLLLGEGVDYVLWGRNRAGGRGGGGGGGGALGVVYSCRGIGLADIIL